LSLLTQLLFYLTVRNSTTDIVW